MNFHCKRYRAYTERLSPYSDPLLLEESISLEIKETDRAEKWRGREILELHISRMEEWISMGPSALYTWCYGGEKTLSETTPSDLT